MKITILTYGTRGDIEPFVALGQGLESASHEVFLAAPSNFSDFLKKTGLPHVCVAGDTQELFATQAFFEKSDPDSFLKNMNRLLSSQYDQIEDAMLKACTGADLIIGSINSIEDMLCISEKLKIPCCVVSLIPAIPASFEFQNMFVTTKNLRWGPLNRATHLLFDYWLWNNCKKQLGKFRKRMGLQPLKGPILHEVSKRGVPVIHAFSPSLVPIPSDWRRNTHVGGFLSFPHSLRTKTDGQPSSELKQWLERGGKPVFFGFGSMPVQNFNETLNLITDSLSELGLRGIVASGWSSSPDVVPPDHVFLIKHADFSWLLPQCVAAVHHGGAGTTHTSVRAGIPTLICGFMGDQFYWGDRMKSLGVGESLPFKKLTKQRLTEKLKICLRPEVVERARELSKRALAEPDGVENTVSILERLFEIAESENQDLRKASG